MVASIGNLVDRELGARGAQLHANRAAIARQEREVARATAQLRRENDRLGRLAEAHARRVKEVGDVQNWAEMLEREFVILEETLRLVGEGEGEGEGSGSGESGSDAGSDGSEDEGGESEGAGAGGGERRVDGKGDAEMRDGEDGRETTPPRAGPSVSGPSSR